MVILGLILIAARRRAPSSLGVVHRPRSRRGQLLGSRGRQRDLRPRALPRSASSPASLILVGLRRSASSAPSAGCRQPPRAASGSTSSHEKLEQAEAEPPPRRRRATTERPVATCRRLPSPGPARASAPRSRGLAEPARAGDLDADHARRSPSTAQAPASRAPLAVGDRAGRRARVVAAGAGPRPPARAARSAADWATRWALHHRRHHRRAPQPTRQQQRRGTPRRAAWPRRARRRRWDGSSRLLLGDGHRLGVDRHPGRNAKQPARTGDRPGDGPRTSPPPVLTTRPGCPRGATRSPRATAAPRSSPRATARAVSRAASTTRTCAGAHGEQPHQPDGDRDQQRQPERQLGGDRAALGPQAPVAAPGSSDAQQAEHVVEQRPQQLVAEAAGEQLVEQAGEPGPGRGADGVLRGGDAALVGAVQR